MDGKQRSYYVEVFLICAAALLLEINYTRIFSFKAYYFFTYFIIGLALLGFGSAGVFVSIIPKLRRFPLDSLLYICSLAGSLSVVVGYFVVSRTPTDTLHLFSTFKQPAILTFISLSIFATFLLIGIMISALFSQRPKSINRIYFVDLVGAGAACGVAIPLMTIFTPPGCIFIAGLLLSVAGLIVGARHSKARLLFALPFVLLLTGGVVWPGLGLEVLLDKSKPLRADLQHAFRALRPHAPHRPTPPVGHTLRCDHFLRIQRGATLYQVDRARPPTLVFRKKNQLLFPVGFLVTGPVEQRAIVE